MGGGGDGKPVTRAIGLGESQYSIRVTYHPDYSMAIRLYIAKFLLEILSIHVHVYGKHSSVSLDLDKICINIVISTCLLTYMQEI